MSFAPPPQVTAGFVVEYALPQFSGGVPLSSNAFGYSYELTPVTLSQQLVG